MADSQRVDVAAGVHARAVSASQRGRSGGDGRSFLEGFPANAAGFLMGYVAVDLLRARRGKKKGR